jgi:hypothetical protein
LVKLRTSLMASCSFCGSRRVTVLSMTLTDGSPVKFASCHRCEGKRWSEDDGSLPLASVLDRARKRT